MGLFFRDPERFEKNMPGDFYTTGECLACGAPEAAAPELLATLSDENWDTYFVRQPCTPTEIEHACAALLSCCTDSIRYGGNDPDIIRRLGNRFASSDNMLPGGPTRYPGENDYSWRHAYGRRSYGRRLPVWERLMLVVDWLRYRHLRRRWR